MKVSTSLVSISVQFLQKGTEFVNYSLEQLLWANPAFLRFFADLVSLSGMRIKMIIKYVID